MSDIDSYETKNGKRYQARWRDAAGVQRSKSFRTLAEAREHQKKVAGGQRGGIGCSVDWLIDAYLNAREAQAAAGVIEHTTYVNYEIHLRRFVRSDEIARKKLSELDTPAIQQFLRRLTGRVSLAYARKIRVSVSVMLKWAVGEGHLAQNPARDAKFALVKRHKAPNLDLIENFDEVDVEAIKIPTPVAAKAILAAAEAFDGTGQAGAQFRLLFGGGMRPSEMLGFPVKMLRFGPDGRVELKIVQRSEHLRGTIGPVKSVASRRKITLGKEASLVLRKYFVAIGQPTDGLLFPTRSGTPHLYSNFYQDVWSPVLAASGYAQEVSSIRTFCGKRLPEGGREKVKREVKRWKPLYTPHHGRHFAASALIAAGAAPKKVQRFLGHSRIELTMNVYGHLFPDQRADDDLADAIDRQLAAAT
ncbi:MAG: hypothetical protein DCF16_15155 [Alphaproteobacteria bacterium]|nr:MAG: hypothetical protein DCF16_15155 [Alphaproteobacteria bacterium]